MHNVGFQLLLLCCLTLMLSIHSSTVTEAHPIGIAAGVGPGDGAAPPPRPAWLVTLEAEEAEQMQREEADRRAASTRDALSFAITELNQLAADNARPFNLPAPNYRLHTLHDTRVALRQGYIFNLKDVIKSVRRLDLDGRIRIYRVKTAEERAENMCMDTSVTLTLTLALEEAPDNTAQHVSLQAIVSVDAQGNTALTALHSYATSTTTRYDMNIIDQLTFTPTGARERADKRREEIQTLMIDKQAQITVMCINLWNLNYWAERQPLLAAELAQSQPDIIAFQEVRARKYSATNESRYQVSDLVNVINMNMTTTYEYVYLPAMGWWEGGQKEWVDEGLAIFSRYPVLSVDSLLLSRDNLDGDDFHQRMLLHVTVLTSFGILNVLTTHLSLSASARQRTLREIGAYIDKLQGPTVLMGDFNQEWDNSLIQFTQRCSLVDAWTAVHGARESNSSSAFTFQSFNQTKRIDYVFIKNMTAITASLAGTTGVEMRTGDSQQSMFPSDHLFLHVGLKVENAHKQSTEVHTADHSNAGPAEHEDQHYHEDL